MVKQLVIGAVLAAGLFCAGKASAQTATSTQPPADTAPPKPINYGDSRSWLCRPGQTGSACDVDHTTTVVAADGKLTRETWAANPKAPIDCFYVYPTVSTDATPNSDMVAGPEELNVSQLRRQLGVLSVGLVSSMTSHQHGKPNRSPERAAASLVLLMDSAETVTL